jgi:hypothetical protein
MLQTRDIYRPRPARVAPVWRAFALVLSFAAFLSTSLLFAGPALAATGTSPFTVGIAPESARPGDEVVVSFSPQDTPTSQETSSSQDTQVSITNCQATFDGEVYSDCQESGRQWSVRFTVPKDASPGARRVRWEYGYGPRSRSLLLDPTSGAQGYVTGTLAFTVLPPEPSFTVEVSPSSARPQQDVAVSFTPTDANDTIKRCQVKLDGVTYDECDTSDGRGSVRFTVTLDSAPGARTLEWALAYQYPDAYGLSKGSAAGTVDFTVLAPQPPPPTFSVSLRPGSAHPGEDVTISLAARDPGVAISGCSAQFGKNAFHDCRRVEDHWSLRVTVPPDTQPGRATVGWSLAYRDTRPSARTPGRANGFLAITVLQPIGPTFTVALSPESANPGSVVTLSFSPSDPSTTITGCTARFAGETFRECRRFGDQWALRFTVPNNAAPGPGSVRWALSYASVTAVGGGDTDGDLTLTVLSPPPTEETGASFVPGVVLLALFVLAGVTLAVVRGSRGRARQDRANHVPSNQTVRATAHAGPMPRLTVRNREPARSRVVRFAVHRPPAVSAVKEVSR